MTQVIVTKLGVLTSADKRALRKAGVVPIEAEAPEDVRFLQIEGSPIGGGALLYAAISALNGVGTCSEARAAFVKALKSSMEEQFGEQSR